MDYQRDLKKTGKKALFLFIGSILGVILFLMAFNFKKVSATTIETYQAMENPLEQIETDGEDLEVLMIKFLLSRIFFFISIFPPLLMIPLFYAYTRDYFKKKASLKDLPDETKESL